MKKQIFFVAVFLLSVTVKAQYVAPHVASLTKNNPAIVAELCEYGYYPMLKAMVDSYHGENWTQRVDGHYYPSSWTQRVDGHYYPSSWTQRVDGHYYPSDWTQRVDGHYYPSSWTQRVNGHYYPSSWTQRVDGHYYPSGGSMSKIDVYYVFIKYIFTF